MDICDIVLEPTEGNLQAPFSKGIYHNKETDSFSVRIFVDLINSRLKVEDYEVKTNLDDMVEYLDFVASENNLSKLILIAREQEWQEFFVHGFFLEAIHPSIFRGKTGYHLARFYSRERRISLDWEKEEEVLRKASDVSRELQPLPKEYTVRTVRKNDIPLLIELYDKVFDTYPTDLTNGDYLNELLKKGTGIFKVVLHGEKIISAASITIDKSTKSAELTDCATLKEYRAQGLMSHLVSALEEDAASLGLITVYTIARALSVGINAAFYKHEYKYLGRFVKNCDICGGYEDMNLWSKKIIKDA